MIKNLDDILTFVILIGLTIYSLRLFIYAYMKSKKIDHDEDATLSKWKLFLEYNDNIEE